VLNIPISMGYGMLALSPLGPDYVPLGILAGLYAVVCGGLVAVLLGANTTMIYAPRSIVTFLIGSLVMQNLVSAAGHTEHTYSPQLILALIFLLVFVAGAVQTLFGVMRLGNLVKYLPAPVLSGFQNAAAVLIFLSQTDIMLGFGNHVSLGQLPANIGAMQPLTLLVGVITCTCIIRGSRITGRVPPTILGFVVGTAAYYLLAGLVPADQIGPLIGQIPWQIPAPSYATEFLALMHDPAAREMFPLIVTSAISLAIVASLDAMLCARLIESDSGNRFSGNAELMRLGAGSMVSACFGGISNGINLAASFANHRGGGRTANSVLVNSLLVLSSLLILSPLIAYLPRVVIAAMLVVVAIQLVDRWTLQLVRKVFSPDTPNRQALLLDLAVILLVSTFAIAANIVLAVFLGFFVTVAVFLIRISKSVIRREYTGDQMHSRKTREPQLMDALSKHGRSITVMELEGPLFFGTAEDLAVRLESLQHSDTRHLIIDMRRVNEVDSTGARILLHAHDRLTRSGRFMLLSAIHTRADVTASLRSGGLLTAAGSGRIFADVDAALEWAEDHVLLSALGGGQLPDEFLLHQFDLLEGMDSADLAAIRPLLERRNYARGDTVFCEGEPGRELFMIASGSASVRLRLAGHKRTARLVTFGPGTVFGELALLDHEPRSATVEADDALVCYVLPYDAFNRLASSEPRLAIRLLTNLGRELSARLRRANRTIYQLDT
jgi:SulP family sulfate permease